MENQDSSFNKRFDKGIVGIFQRIMASLPFGLLVMLSIIGSFILLYLESYLYNKVESVPDWISHINNFFNYIFVVEVVLLLINIDYRLDPPQRNKILTKLKHFVDSAPFGITVMVLILVSVSLIFIEMFLYGGNEDKVPAWILQTNEWLTNIFIIELILRWMVSYSTHNFLSNYWIDMLAVMPTFRIFRIGRVLRILRVLRLFRVFSIGSEFTRKFRLFGKIFEGRLTEIGIISSFGIFAIFFGAVGLSQFEIGKESEINSVSDAF